MCKFFFYTEIQKIVLHSKFWVLPEQMSQSQILLYWLVTCDILSGLEWANQISDFSSRDFGIYFFFWIINSFSMLERSTNLHRAHWMTCPCGLACQCVEFRLIFYPSKFLNMLSSLKKLSFLNTPWSPILLCNKAIDSSDPLFP